jgi:hypothetical protein
MRVQQHGLKPRVLALLIALTCAGRMERTQMGNVQIFKKLIEIRQNKRSYC